MLFNGGILYEVNIILQVLFQRNNWQPAQVLKLPPRQHYNMHWTEIRMTGNVRVSVSRHTIATGYLYQGSASSLVQSILICRSNAVVLCPHMV
jgi:hypothetical protein